MLPGRTGFVTSPAHHGDVCRRGKAQGCDPWKAGPTPVHHPWLSGLTRLRAVSRELLAAHARIEQSAAQRWSVCYSKAMRYEAEQMRIYQNERRARLRRELIEMLGGKCVRCDVTEELQFDHIHPEMKLFAISNGLDKPRATLLAELAKCQLLCKDHHNLKTKEHGAQNIGSRNGRAKLTERDIPVIRSSNLSSRKIALQYDINKGTVLDIRAGRRWNHVP